MRCMPSEEMSNKEDLSGYLKKTVAYYYLRGF
jgi:hypothetical protein